MSIESLKEQARTHEQKEEWGKAIGLYRKAIDKLEQDDQPDIGLYNRVADLQVRQGQLEEAVKNYEKAIDLYVEAELPNNAIAVCKKVVRNMPMRHTIYLKMGQIRGRQGFLTEARLNFLTYAERMQSAGSIDEGLRALGELADLAPEDVEIRLAIAGQMQSHGRKDEAIAQLQTGYHAASRRGLPTEPFEAMLAQLGSSPSDAPPAPAAVGGDLGDDDALGGFGEIMLAGGPEDAAPAKAGAEVVKDDDELGGFGEIVIGGTAPEKEEEEEEDDEDAEPLPTFSFDDDEDEEEFAALPLLGGDELDEDEEGEPLPLLGDGFSATRAEGDLNASSFGEREEREGEYAETEGELPALDLGELSLEEPEPAVSPQPTRAREAAMEEARSERAPTPEPTSPQQRPALVPDGLAPRPQRAAGPETDPMGHESLAARGDVQGAMAALRKLVRNTPNDLALRQRMVEYASRLDDRSEMVPPWIELAEAYERLHQPDKARPLFEQVLAVEPENARALKGLGPAAAAGGGGDFVDLGSFLLGDDDEEKTTRFVVAYEEPSGDEHADFAKMLSQFKAKVAENLGADDVRAHQDLGTAYKEMGLVNEAISEFQQALRASASYLPAYELLGQCFMEKGEPETAVRTLKRALDMPFEVEDELLGIYYWLGRAHQQLGNKGDAVEFYDRVFSLDINFADVTERLRALR